MCQITLVDDTVYIFGQTLQFSFETRLINHLPDCEPQFLNWILTLSEAKLTVCSLIASSTQTAFTYRIAYIYNNILM